MKSFRMMILSTAIGQIGCAIFIIAKSSIWIIIFFQILVCIYIFTEEETAK